MPSASAGNIDIHIGIGDDNVIIPRYTDYIENPLAHGGISYPCLKGNGAIVITGHVTVKTRSRPFRNLGGKAHINPGGGIGHIDANIHGKIVGVVTATDIFEIIISNFCAGL